MSRGNSTKGSNLSRSIRRHSYVSCVKIVTMKHTKKKREAARKYKCLLRQTSEGGNNINRKLCRLYANMIRCADYKTEQHYNASCTSSAFLQCQHHIHEGGTQLPALRCYGILSWPAHVPSTTDARYCSVQSCNGS